MQTTGNPESWHRPKRSALPPVVEFRSDHRFRFCHRFFADPRTISASQQDYFHGQSLGSTWAKFHRFTDEVRELFLAVDVDLCKIRPTTTLIGATLVRLGATGILATSSHSNGSDPGVVVIVQ